MRPDTDNFLFPLRRLSPPPPANSHANTACSDTLTEAGYARCGNENQPTVLSWILLPDLPHLLDGTVCHAVRRVNGRLFHRVNTENEASCQGKRLSKRPSFTSFCASGNDLFFRRGNERDENDVKRG